MLEQLSTAHIIGGGHTKTPAWPRTNQTVRVTDAAGLFLAMAIVRSVDTTEGRALLELIGEHGRARAFSADARHGCWREIGRPHWVAGKFVV